VDNRASARRGPVRSPDPPAPQLLRPSPWRTVPRRAAPLAALLIVAVAAYLSGALHMLTPQALGREQATLHSAFVDAPAASLALFVLSYAVLTGACLPVAMVLSVTAGAIFGLWTASAVVLVGATGGALLTYAAARSAFAPLLRARAHRDARLQRLLQGFEADSFTYVLTLRFIPMAPFALVNVAAGLAAVPVRTFTLATVVGGVPTALIYTGLGAGLGASLGSRHSLHEALHSPGLWLPLTGLAILSALPLLLKRLRARS